MRMKQLVVTGMALMSLFGCGNNTANESMDERGWDHIENVRNQPGGQGLNDQGMNQYPGNRPGINNQSDQNRMIDGTRREQPGRFMKDGRIEDDMQRSNRDLNMSQRWKNRSGEQGNQQKSNQQGQYLVDEQIADHVSSEVDEIDGAYVLTMGDNAYVACHLDNDQASSREDDLSDEVEKKVTRAVKDSNNKIDNVFVSSNPDFVDLTSNYMRDIDSGEPIEGFVDQFTEMIERVFPTRSR